MTAAGKCASPRADEVSTLADSTGSVETELFAQNYRNYSKKNSEPSEPGTDEMEDREQFYLIRINLALVAGQWGKRR